MKKHVHTRVLDESRKRRNERPDRTILHVWHAKRFKMEQMFLETEFPISVPICNATKNRRNLYRRAKHNNCFYYMTPITASIAVNAGLSDVKQAIYCSTPGDHFHHIIFEAGQMIGPIEVLAVEPEKIIVSTHRSTARKVLDFLSTRFDVDEDEHGFEERIRLVGPQAIEILQTSMNITLTFPESVSHVTQNEMVFISSKIADSRPFVDIMLSTVGCKQKWQQLVRNRSHLVGGLENLRVLYFNAGHSFFPDFGYPDARGTSLDNVMVCRDPQLSDLQTQSIKGLEQKLTGISSQTLIPVCLIARGKGNVGTGASIHVQESGGESIGVVEFGAFCLEKGRGKGMACLSVESLLTLIRRLSSVVSAEANAGNDILCYIKEPASTVTRVTSVHILKA